MTRISKRRRTINELLVAGKSYSFVEAVAFLQQLPPLKFVESIEVSVNLGIDPTKSDQTVRGAVVLPHGSGKNVRVAVFAQGELADQAREAGADVVCFEDLAERIKAGELDFDHLIATPDAMRLVSQLGQILGPRGLMPNPKVGTVTNEIAQAVKNAKRGQVAFRADKGGVVHCLLGKLNFTAEQLRDNFRALLVELRKAKPVASKGIYIQKVVISSTMGPGLLVESSEYTA